MTFLLADAVVKDFIASPAALMPGLAPDADLLDSCPEGLSLPAESMGIPHCSSRNVILFGALLYPTQRQCTWTHELRLSWTALLKWLSVLGLLVHLSTLGQSAAGVRRKDLLGVTLSMRPRPGFRLAQQPYACPSAGGQLMHISANGGAACAGEGMEAELMPGAYAHIAADAAAAIGLSLVPLDQDPPGGSRGRIRLTPVWEGEQVAESPYQRFIQVNAAALRATCCFQADGEPTVGALETSNRLCCG